MKVDTKTIQKIAASKLTAKISDKGIDFSGKKHII